MKQVFDFLVDLCINNNKEWFDENRSRYVAAKKEMEAFVDELIENVSVWDQSVKGMRAKDCIFRIFRDTRFSNDKTPYKTNFGAFITPDGKKCERAGYYVHIEPDNAFVSGGIYMPPAAELLKIRTAIFENAGAYKSIVANPAIAQNFQTVEDGKLKTAPRGFPKDFENIDLLRNKHFAVSRRMSDEMIVSGQMRYFVLENFKTLHPLVNYINTILG